MYHLSSESIMVVHKRVSLVKSLFGGFMLNFPGIVHGPLLTVWSSCSNPFVSLFVFIFRVCDLMWNTS